MFENIKCSSCGCNVWYHYSDDKTKAYCQTCNELQPIPIGIKLACETAYNNVGDEQLFPNHTDKDIFEKGFMACAEIYLMEKYITLQAMPSKVRK